MVTVKSELAAELQKATNQLRTTVGDLERDNVWSTIHHLSEVSQKVMFVKLSLEEMSERSLRAALHSDCDAQAPS